MNRSRIKQTGAAIFACASVAAVVGIATGAAAPSNNGSSNSKGRGPSVAAYGTAIGPPPPGGLVSTEVAKGKGPRLFFRGPPGVTAFAVGGPAPAFTGPPVHSEMVVPNEAGDGFITITEGTEKATYKTVTLDIPSDAKVVRDGDKAQLSDLQKGDQVHVSQSPNGSFVFATDSAFQQKMLKQFRQHFKDLPKPPAGVPGGMPPGLPPMLRGRGH
jgi:hypothetical protein